MKKTHVLMSMFLLSTLSCAGPNLILKTDEDTSPSFLGSASPGTSASISPDHPGSSNSPTVGSTIKPSSVTTPTPITGATSQPVATSIPVPTPTSTVSPTASPSSSPSPSPSPSTSPSPSPSPSPTSSLGTIVRITGTAGSPGFSGDNGDMLNSQIYKPYGIALDQSGNIYFSDSGNYRIRKVDGANKITTIAGIGTTGSGGDGGPASSAQFNSPKGLSIDSSGNIFIADDINQKIRKIATDGTITTVAGGGTPADGIGDGGQATSAKINIPNGIAIDNAGNIYVADTGQSSIRKINTSGVITTVAGVGGGVVASGDGGPATLAGLLLPYGVSVDSSGNIYIADTYNNRIRKVNVNGIISTIAGTGTAGFSGDGGPATSAKINFPYGVSVDSSGNVYFSDSKNNRIRKIATDNTITTVVGTGTAGAGGDGGSPIEAQLSNPTFLTIVNGEIFISDYGNSVIRAVLPH